MTAAMASPSSMGGLDGLKAIEMADLDRYTAAVHAGQQKGWAYYFPFLLTRHRPGQSEILLAEEEGSVCVFRRDMRDATPRLDLYLAPAPMNPAVLARCLERANDHNGDRSARVLRIDSQDVEAASSVGGLRITPRKEQYVYDPRAYDSLAGGRYKTLRQTVARVDRLDDVEVVPYAHPFHGDGCRELLKRWRDGYGEAHGQKIPIGASLRALDLAAALPDSCMRGIVVLVGGEVSAFTLGGEIRPGFVCLWEGKAEHGIQGLGHYLTLSALRHFAEHDFVNTGSDAGRDGLRKHKDSFRPIEMHAEFRASQ